MNPLICLKKLCDISHLFTKLWDILHVSVIKLHNILDSIVCFFAFQPYIKASRHFRITVTGQ